MNKTALKKLKANRMLNIIWGIVTALFLLLTLFYIFQNEQRNMEEQVEETAELISTNLDNLIDKVTQAIYSTNIKENNINDCKNTLLPKLQYIVLNVPEIAGLTFLEKTTPPVVCSTMPHNDRYAKIVEDSRPLMMFGPVTLEDLDHPVFIIQQQIGDYYINIDILINNLAQLFVSKVPFVKSIALYDKFKHKILFRMFLIGLY